MIIIYYSRVVLICIFTSVQLYGRKLSEKKLIYGTFTLKL